MSKKELVEFLIENFTNEYGLVDLQGLDFGDKGVVLSGMKANKIHQGDHTAKIIFQSYHTATEIYQFGHKATEIFQDND